LSLIFVCIIGSMQCLSQTKQCDSLYIDFAKSTGNDKLEKIEYYLHQVLNVNVDSFASVLKQYKTLLPNTNKEKIFSYYLFEFERMYPLNEHDKLLEFIDSVSINADTNNISIRNLQLGKASVLIKKGAIKEAIQNGSKQLVWAISNKEKEFEIKTLNILGWAHLELGNVVPAKKYLLASLQQCNDYQKWDLTSTIYSNLTACYGMQGNLDSASYCVEAGLKYAEKFHLLKQKANLLNLLLNINQVKNNFSDADKTMNQILEIRKVIGDKFYYVSDIMNFANNYFAQNQINKGHNYLKSAEQIIIENKMRIKLPMLYNTYIQYYRETNNKVYEIKYWQKLVSIKDSLYQESTATELATIQTKYKIAANELQIEKQQNELSKKNNLIALLLGLAIIFGLIMYSFNSNRKKKKLLQHQQELSLQEENHTRAMIEAEEKERNRMAADLHDGIGQLIIGSKFNLEAIDVKTLGNYNQQIVENSKILLEQAGKEIRQVSHNIMPNMLLKVGLGGAIKNFVEKMEGANIAINVDISGLQQKLESEKEIILYRVIQECCNNVIKHAQATSLYITIINDAKGINIQIEDNGIGFNVQKALAKDGIGLKNIKARVAFLKGHLEINSDINQGTLVVINIPNKI
jgi:two-component system, NarL family, sensor kinase